MKWISSNTSCGLAMMHAKHRAEVGERILIRNVTIFDPDNAAEDVVVNILFADKKLEVVTQNKSHTKKAHQAYDAQQGFLVGQPNPGQRPSFIILYGDPRGDIKILLDTDTYARFAVRKGVIVRNRLQQAWETAVRWSSLDLVDGAVDGGKMDIISQGLNWWLTSFFMTSVNYRHIQLDCDGLDGTSDGLNARLMLLLE